MAFRKLSKWPSIEFTTSLHRFNVIDIERREKTANRAGLLGCFFEKYATKLCFLQVFNRSRSEDRANIRLDEVHVQVRQICSPKSAQRKTSYRMRRHEAEGGMFWTPDLFQKESSDSTISLILSDNELGDPTHCTFTVIPSGSKSMSYQCSRSDASNEDSVLSGWQTFRL